MSHFENFLRTDQTYADLHGTEYLPQRPRTHVAIVTCIDSHLHVAQALGLALGDAHILRNADGRVTGDIVRPLMISQQQLGTREIVVLHHVDYGVQSFTNEAFTAQLERDLGADVHDKDFLPFSDMGENVHGDIAVLRNSPLIPEDVMISGAIYDVDTGRIGEIK